jgi:hypothetical protein
LKMMDRSSFVFFLLPCSLLLARRHNSARLASSWRNWRNRQRSEILFFRTSGWQEHGVYKFSNRRMFWFEFALRLVDSVTNRVKNEGELCTSFWAPNAGI